MLGLGIKSMKATRESKQDVAADVPAEKQGDAEADI